MPLWHILSSARVAHAQTPQPSELTLQVPIGGTTTITGFNQYVAVLYQYIGVFLISFGIIVIMWSGIQWIVWSDSEKKIRDSKSRITAALIGIALYLLSFSILNIVNPDLLKLSTVEVAKIELPVDVGIDTGPSSIGRSVLDSRVVKITGDNVFISPAASGPYAFPQVVSAIQRAASILKGQGYTFVVTAAFRTPETQVKLVKDNCAGATCNDQFICTIPQVSRNSSSCRLVCRMEKGPSACPHTTGQAVDAWGGTPQGTQFPGKMKNDCTANVPACRQWPSQKALIESMWNAGFCNLCHEPWHFESPKVSGCCARSWSELESFDQQAIKDKRPGFPASSYPSP